MVERLYVNFGEPGCIGIWEITGTTDRQTERQTNADEILTPSTYVGVCRKLLRDVNDRKQAKPLTTMSMLGEVSPAPRGE